MVCTPVNLSKHKVLTESERRLVNEWSQATLDSI